MSLGWWDGKERLQAELEELGEPGAGTSGYGLGLCVQTVLVKHTPKTALRDASPGAGGMGGPASPL